MAGLSFRVGETKTTEAGAVEIVVETKPAPVPSVDGLTGTFGIPTPILIDPKLVALTPGQHHFQLVVEDGLGRRSAPDTVVVTVLGSS